MGWKNKKIIFVSVIIIGFLIAAWFIFFTKNKKQAEVDGLNNLEILVKDALNVKVKKVDLDFFNSDNFKNLKFFEFKLNNLNDLQKNNKRPFEPPFEK